MSITTIRVEYATRDRLKQIGNKGQTYDLIINELIQSKTNKQDSLDRRIGGLQSSESGVYKSLDPYESEYNHCRS